MHRYRDDLGGMRLREWNILYFKDFFFRNEIKPGNARSGLLRLSREMSSLATSLPVYRASSIFLVSDEDRMDVLRALITGPEGTPYENGCYLFDIYLPPNYPDSPPKVHFLTTGAGHVRCVLAFSDCYFAAYLFATIEL